MCVCDFAAVRQQLQTQRKTIMPASRDTLPVALLLAVGSAAAAAALLPPPPPPAPPAPPGSPNILFIAIDDMRPSIGAMVSTGVGIGGGREGCCLTCNRPLDAARVPLH